MYWKRLFCPVSSSKRTYYTPEQCCWEGLVKVGTKHDSISPLPYSPFYKLYHYQVCIGKYRGMWKCGPSVPVISDSTHTVQNCTLKRSFERIVGYLPM